MRSGFQRLDDGRLYFQVVGTGEPVVLVHAFTLHSGLWDAQVAALAPEYRVVRYDMRGFGRSSLPARPYRHADDLKALLDGLGLRDVHLVGLSMGGGSRHRFRPGLSAYAPHSRGRRRQCRRLSPLVGDLHQLVR